MCLPECQKALIVGEMMAGAREVERPVLRTCQRRSPACQHEHKQTSGDN